MIRIGTRGSDLALWQSRRVAALIRERLGREAELVVISTQGDRDQRRPIEALGTVGVFAKELQRALLAREVDIAVHSLKDLPTIEPEGLALAAIPERADPRDVFLSRHPGGIAALPAGARVGTSSRRRRVQLRAMRPDLEIVEMRGNVPTRVEKLRRGDFDAIVLAAAGLDRLAIDLEGLDRTRLPVEEFVPAPGQGALAIEARAADEELVRALREKIHDAAAGARIACERRLLRIVEGGCTVPLGAHAVIAEGGEIVLRAVLGDMDDDRAPLRRALVRARAPEEAADRAFRILRPGGGARAASDTEPERAALRGKSIAILRPREEAAELAHALERAGARVECVPAIETPALLAPAEIEAALAALPDGAFVLVLSPRGASLLPAGPFAAGRLRAGALGAGTAAALARAGIPVDLLGERGTGGGLAEAFLALGGRGVVAVAQARGGRPECRDALRAAGSDVREIHLYETRPLAVPDGGWDAALVASPSAAEALPGAGLRAKLVAIGETTRAALEARGLRVAAVAARPTAEGMTAALAAALGPG